MKKRLTAIIMAAALMLSAAACSTTSGQSSTASETSVASTTSESSNQQSSQPEKVTSIENWNEDSPAMKSIMAFVEEVTNEKSTPPCSR